MDNAFIIVTIFLVIIILKYLGLFCEIPLVLFKSQVYYAVIIVTKWPMQPHIVNIFYILIIISLFVVESHFYINIAYI